MKAAGEGKHKIKMDSMTKDLRANLFTDLKPNEYNQRLIKRLTKQERAEMVFRFHLAGVKIAALCELYSISPGYQRELRGLKEKEWTINLMNCDEEFVQFLKEFKTKHPDIKDGSPESFCLITYMPWYILAGCEETTKEEFMAECDKLIKLISQERGTKNTQVSLKSVEVET